jgi:cyclopropane fatty-acyl-phospholipid synthase-like methyltransferase
MDRANIRRQVGRMRRDWDRRAQENARHYVATGQEEWTDEEFFAAGEQELQDQVFNDLENICQGRDPKTMKVLEIGCGAGRVTRALARFFGEVYAVDISRNMVRQARRAVAEFPNAHIFRNNGRDLQAVRRRWWHRFGIGGKLEIDFAFSCLVFQHIPSRAVIESYVSEVNRLLKPDGLFKFQVQGNTDEEPNLDDSWIGYWFNPEDARKLAADNGFELRFDWGAGSQYYWLWFFKK